MPNGTWTPWKRVPSSQLARYSFRAAWAAATSWMSMKSGYSSRRFSNGFLTNRHGPPHIGSDRGSV